MILALVVWLAQVATPQPSAVPSPTAIPSPSATALPSPRASATPVALPTPMVLPPKAVPQILAYRISDTIFTSGKVITGTLITSTNVAAAEFDVAGRYVPLQRPDFGVFQLTYRLPRIPRFMHGHYTARLIAKNAYGQYAERDIAVEFR